MKNRKGIGWLLGGAALLALTGVLFCVNAWMASRAAAPSPDPDGVTNPEEGCPVDWGYWLEVNPDIVAWIQIPGTEISQPIVQAPTDDPRYYLTHDVYRGWNYYGCPYVDADCQFGIESWGATVFGHNITTPNAMFHDLEYYHDPEFLASHQEVIIYTPSGTERLTVAGSRTVGGWEELKRVSFDSAADFAAWRNETLSAVGAGPAEEFGRMLTLCSCSYFFNPSNERTLVYAV